MLQVGAKIIYNKNVKGSYFHLALRAPQIAKVSLPGQFLNIKVSDGYEPLLRRPLSVHRRKGADIELLYEVVGKGTQALSQRKAGEYLDVIGPLGHGFDYQAPNAKYQLSILVAGGMGVAPLAFLAEKLAKLKPLVLIGAKTKNRIICEQEFKDLGCRVKIATDDGSRGHKGKVTELLKEFLPNNSITQELKNSIYACGTKPMLKEIARISKEYSIPAEVSLEEHMACGIGACLGCVVNTVDGFKRVCKEGPVFSADKIIWSNEA